MGRMVDGKVAEILCCINISTSPQRLIL